jgi:hypothetical protein
LARRQDVPSGLPSVLRLNCKPAEYTSSLQCFDRIGEVVDCRGFATWDLTEQVRPIAEGGGGPLCPCSRSPASGYDHI